MSEAITQRVCFRHDGVDLLVLEDVETLPRVGEHVTIELEVYAVVIVIHLFAEAEAKAGYRTVIVQLDPVDVKLTLTVDE